MTQRGDPTVSDDYLDRLDVMLRGQVEGTGARVAHEGQGLRVAIPCNIAFHINSADVRSDFFAVLNSIAKVLTTFDQTSIRIIGHTDSAGSDTLTNRSASAATTRQMSRRMSRVLSRVRDKAREI